MTNSAQLITDRQPTKEDGAPLDGHVRMARCPGNSGGEVYVHWSHVGVNVPWRHSSDWQPRTLLGVAGQWVSGTVKPLESEATNNGYVQIRLPDGDVGYHKWGDITPDHIWRPSHSRDLRPVVLVTTEFCPSTEG